MLTIARAEIRLQCRRVIARPGVRSRIFEDDGFAPLQIVDVGSVVAKLKHAGQALNAGCVPVPRDGDRFLGGIDRAVAGAADAKRLPE
jgi:hypothetical protein